MRTIGIDLAVTAAHKAVVMAPDGQFLTPVLSFQTNWDQIEHLVSRAREGVAPDYPLQAVLEPTGMAWFPVAVALERLGVIPYLVNGQRVHDLRRFYKRHSSSDRISARVLARMAVVDPESLYPLEIPSARRLACQRGCKELDRLQTLLTASQNRLRDTDRFAWPGLESLCPDIFSPAARFFRQHWYDPAGVVQAGSETLRHSFAAVIGGAAQLDWGAALLRLAEAVLKLYGPDRLDYALLQQEVCREQHRLEALEAEAKRLWRETIRPL